MHALACREPCAPREDLDLVRHDERRIEADAELPDQVRIRFSSRSTSPSGSPPCPIARSCRVAGTTSSRLMPMPLSLMLIVRASVSKSTRGSTVPADPRAATRPRSTRSVACPWRSDAFEISSRRKISRLLYRRMDHQVQELLDPPPEIRGSPEQFQFQLQSSLFVHPSVVHVGWASECSRANYPTESTELEEYGDVGTRFQPPQAQGCFLFARPSTLVAGCRRTGNRRCPDSCFSGMAVAFS